MSSDRLAEYASGPDGDDGFLVSVRGESLLAQRFDPRRLRLTGEPVTISDTVATTGLGYAHFSAPGAGALIYGSNSFGQRRLQWRSRDGKPIRDEGPADVYFSPHLSPDGSKVAVARVSSAVNADVWVYEFARGVMTRLTFEPGVDNYPVWSSDGLQVAFSAARGGPRSLFVTDASGSGARSASPMRFTITSCWIGRATAVTSSTARIIRPATPMSTCCPCGRRRLSVNLCRC